MKILYYFAERSTPMYQWQRIHFIDELSRYGIEIKVFNPEQYNSFEEAQEKVQELVKKEHFDMFMTTYGRELKILRETIYEIKKIGVPTLLFTPDNLSVPYFDKQLASEYDLVWLTAKETQYLYKKWGANTFFAPYAANPYTYIYNPLPIIRRICFIGTPHGSRSNVINTISGFSLPIDLYFGKNEKARKDDADNIIVPKYELHNSGNYVLLKNYMGFREGRRILASIMFSKIKGREKIIIRDNVDIHHSQTFDKMIELYSRYALSLSFTSYGMTDIFRNNVPVVNLRNFEIPMCGGIQFCRYSEEMTRYFEDGKEIIIYKDEEELVDKARYIVEKATDAEIFKIKESARKRTESDHTWFCRFKIAFDKLGLKY